MGNVDRLNSMIAMLDVIQMTCYFRHMKETFDELGLEVTPENKREIDRAIHNLVGVKYKDCSSTWREIKKRRSEDEEEFMTALKKNLRKI